MTSGRPERDRQVAHVEVAERHEQPADALGDEHVGPVRRRARGADASAPSESVAPASSAARCGETAGPNVALVTPPASTPAAAASSS